MFRPSEFHGDWKCPVDISTKRGLFERIGIPRSHLRRDGERAAHSRERTIVKTSGKIMLAVAIIGAVGAIIARQLPKTERSYH